MWVHMHRFLSLSLWVCACKSPGVCFWFPAGELCITEQLTHQFSGLGRLQDLCRDKKKRQTKKVRDKLYYHQCLLSFTRYKVPLRSCCKQIKVNTDTGLLDTVSCGNCIKCPAERPQTILKLVLQLVSVCSLSSFKWNWRYWSIYSPFQTWTLYFNMI